MKTSHEPASELLDLVRTLFAELHRQTGHDRHITLDSSLDRELGFDSLARVELILRIQRAFGVNLPEDTLGHADTPRDLLQALHKGHAERIRLCGIDCPEKGQAFDKKAKQAASELVYGKEVRSRPTTMTSTSGPFETCSCLMG